LIRPRERPRRGAGPGQKPPSERAGEIPQNGGFQKAWFSWPKIVGYGHGSVVEARPPTPAGQVYQLKVTLLEVVPRIWRRFQVPGDMKLSALHRTLQAVMGWENSHLHGSTSRGSSTATGQAAATKIPRSRRSSRHAWTSARAR
jgi:hypothetical protein